MALLVRYMPYGIRATKLYCYNSTLK